MTPLLIGAAIYFLIGVYLIGWSVGTNHGAGPSLFYSAGGKALPKPKGEEQRMLPTGNMVMMDRDYLSPGDIVTDEHGAKIVILSNPTPIGSAWEYAVAPAPLETRKMENERDTPTPKDKLLEDLKAASEAEKAKALPLTTITPLPPVFFGSRDDYPYSLPPIEETSVKNLTITHSFPERRWITVRISAPVPWTPHSFIIPKGTATIDGDEVYWDVGWMEPEEVEVITITGTGTEEFVDFSAEFTSSSPCSGSGAPSDGLPVDL